jgi:CRISPR-associated protein Csm4
MNYKIYQFVFHGAVRFGKNTLDDTDYSFCADTLFSALCLEALKNGQAALDRLYQYASTGQVLFSDAFPFMQDVYFLPKPMLHIEADNDRGDSTVKKAYKKLQFIPADDFSTYLKGEYDIRHAPDLNGNLGRTNLKVSASIRGEDETTPYRVGAYYFHEGNGLYIIVGYEDEAPVTFIEELLRGLSYSGIGGKRASGMGRFEVIPKKLPVSLQDRLERQGSTYEVLSVSLPKEEEMEQALGNAEYLLRKRSGFVASDTYAPNQLRKKDLYVLKAGSCVRQKYEGDIYDVSDKPGTHPVYRYAKPMFMEVDA